MRDAETIGPGFYPHSVNARYDNDASGIRLHRIVNVNGTIDIKSLVSRGAKKDFKLAIWHPVEQP